MQPSPDFHILDYLFILTMLLRVSNRLLVLSWRILIRQFCIILLMVVNMVILWLGMHVSHLVHMPILRWKTLVSLIHHIHI